MKKEKKDKDSSSDNEEEEPKIEKPSYTYWKRDSDKAADHTQFHPQPASIQQPTTQAQNPAQANKICSAWNKAGTWEEKKLNKNQVEDFFNGRVKNNPMIYTESFKLSSFSSYSGDVNKNI